MKVRILIISIFAFLQFAQAQEINYHSPENIRKFADYLFCDRDYLRAALEYEKLSERSFNDTLLFKTALSYSIIREYSLAHKYLRNSHHSPAYTIFPVWNV